MEILTDPSGCSFKQQMDRCRARVLPNYEPKIGDFPLDQNIMERGRYMKQTMYLIVGMALVISFAGCTSKSTKMKNKEK